MVDIDLNWRAEIAPGEYKRLGDCTRAELGAAEALLVSRILGPVRRELANGARELDENVLARRGLMRLTEEEKLLLVYCEAFKMLEDERSQGGA